MEIWLEQAKQLQTGQRVRINCCNNNATMVISNNSRGYSAYCFRCGVKSFKPHGQRSISELAKQQACLAFENKSVELPSDFVSIDRATPQAMHWILRYGITMHQAKSYGIGYSPSMDRVILPVYEGYEHERPIYTQARALGQDKPKYLNTDSGSNAIVFYSHSHQQTDTCVITEDYLSTIKVGYVHQAASILGTNMTLAKACQLVSKYKNFIVWLDDDEAGHRGALAAKQQLWLQGADKIYILFTQNDPKAIPHDMIKMQISSIITGMQWHDRYNSAENNEVPEGL